MCLVVDRESTEACCEKLRASGGARTVYKFLDLRDDLALVSPMMCHQEWRPGWHEASGAIPSEMAEGLSVGAGGFHVFFDAPQIQDDSGFCGQFEPYPLVPFWAFERDFLCAGRDPLTHALFRRLYLDPGEYELARIRLLESQKERLVQPERRDDEFVCGFGSALTLDKDELEEAISHCKARLARLAGTRPLPEPPSELDMARDWIRGQVESGEAVRALVDVGPSASEPAGTPVVWVHEGEHYAVLRNGRRIGRSVPMRTVMAAVLPVFDPPSAA